MTAPVASTATDERIARLDERVDGLEQSIGHVVTAVDKLSSKLDRASQPQWQLLLGVVGLIVGLVGYVGTAWQAPLTAAIVRQQEDIRGLQASVVPRQEVAGYVAMAKENADLLRQLMDRSEQRIEKRLDRMEGPFFSRRGTE